MEYDIEMIKHRLEMQAEAIDFLAEHCGCEEIEIDGADVHIKYVYNSQLKELSLTIKSLSTDRYTPKPSITMYGLKKAIIIKESFGKGNKDNHTYIIDKLTGHILTIDEIDYIGDANAK